MNALMASRFVHNILDRNASVTTNALILVATLLKIATMTNARWNANGAKDTRIAKLLQKQNMDLFVTPSAQRTVVS